METNQNVAYTGTIFYIPTVRTETNNNKCQLSLHIKYENNLESVILINKIFIWTISTI